MEIERNDIFIEVEISYDFTKGFRQTYYEPGETDNVEITGAEDSAGNDILLSNDEEREAESLVWDELASEFDDYKELDY